MSKLVCFAIASFVRGEDTETKTNLPQVPPFNGRVGVRSSLLEYVSLEISSTYFTEQSKIAFGEKTTPGYVLFDAYVSSMPINLSIASVKLSAGVENIFDKQYRNHLATNRGQILSEPGRNFFIRTSITL